MLFSNKPSKRLVRKEALQEFQARSAEVRPPLTEKDYAKPRRRTWSERAKIELEAAMALDLDPDRRARRKYVPSYERIAEHLKEKGYN